MRRSPAFVCASLAVLALAGCGSANKASRSEPPPTASPTADTSAANASERGAAGAPPNIGVTAAPGVAFNYHHSFALEPDKIAAVQEQHAAACEALGVDHCRITGMSYHRRNDHDIDAQLEFRLDPALARHFGQSALQSVQEAGGMLVEARITGTDVGTSIRRAGKSIDELNAELARLQRQIADPSTHAGQKDTLRYDAEQLRQQIRSVQAERETQQESLATTPVVFDYGTDEALASGPNFAAGLRDAGETLVWALYGLMRISVVVLPFVAAVLLLGWAIRRLRRRFDYHAPAVPIDAPDPVDG